MTRQEFSKAVAMIDKVRYDDTDLSIFEGCGLVGFEPIHTTIEAVAKITRYQCLQMNGDLDLVELNEMAHIARRKFLIV